MQIQDVRFFAADPSSNAYRDALLADLKGALWVRFLVCYFNKDGFDALSPQLAKLLRHPQSRGLATLTCTCEASGIQALWEAADRPRGRLKCFVPVQREGPGDIRLLHSKVVVIGKPASALGAAERAVLYTGSQNWTAPGLRLNAGGNKVNVESGVRIESDLDPRWLTEVYHAEVQGTGHPIADALRQIDSCFGMASCTDLSDQSAAVEIASWLRDNCKEDQAAPGAEPFIVCSAVLAGEVDANTAKQGLRQLRGTVRTPPAVKSLIYVQHYNYQDREPDTFDSEVTWAILVWGKSEWLKNAEVPWLVLCRPRAVGRRRTGRPELQRIDWLLYDPRHNSPGSEIRRGEVERRPESMTVPKYATRNGVELKVEYWRLAPVAAGTPTSALNQHTVDSYAVLEVVAVRQPTSVFEPHSNSWEGTELPFHTSKQRRARRGFVVHDPDGNPSSKRADTMVEEQKRFFNIAPRRDGGPKADQDLLRQDFFPCVSPINQILFNRKEARGRPAEGFPEQSRQAVFEIPSEVDPDDARATWVSRMERLYAPGTPHICCVLNLNDFELQALGWAKK